MRQTLIRIPLDGPWWFGPLQLPGFGFGTALALWCLLGGWWLWRHRDWLKGDERAQILVPFFVWLAVAVVIVMLPGLVQRSSEAVIAETTAALEKDPASAKLLVRRGIAYQKKRDFVRAREDFRTALKVDPYSAEAAQRLAWLLATCPEAAIRDGDEAVEIARRIQVPNAVTFDVLAASYAESGRWKLAVEAGRKAASLAGRAKSGLDLSEVRRRLDGYVHERPCRDNVSTGSFLPLWGYGFMLFVGFLVGAWTASRRAESVGMSKETVWDGGTWLLISGVIGSRLFYLVQYRDKVFAGAKTPQDFLIAAIDLREGGLVFYGGLMFGLVVFVWMCRRRGLNPLQFLDVLAPSFFLGVAFGRLGCLMNGCCYGDRCDLPWAVEFPLGSVPDMALVVRGVLNPDSTTTLLLHPSQIYSSLNAILLTVLTAWWFRRPHKHGSVLALGLIAYPIGRFTIEFLRGDEAGKFGTSLTISQWVSLGTIAVGIALALWLRKQPEPTEPSASGAAQPLN